MIVKQKMKTKTKQTKQKPLKPKQALRARKPETLRQGFGFRRCVGGSWPGSRPGQREEEDGHARASEASVPRAALQRGCPAEGSPTEERGPGLWKSKSRDEGRCGEGAMLGDGAPTQGNSWGGARRLTLLATAGPGAGGGRAPQCYGGSQRHAPISTSGTTSDPTDTDKPASVPASKEFSLEGDGPHTQ